MLHDPVNSSTMNGERATEDCGMLFFLKFIRYFL